MEQRGAAAGLFHCKSCTVFLREKKESVPLSPSPMAECKQSPEGVINPGSGQGPGGILFESSSFCFRAGSRLDDGSNQSNARIKYNSPLCSFTSLSHLLP